MWKRFKKNEIVIYAIALMLVTAGYFNYTTNIKEDSTETYSEDIQNIAEEAKNTEDNSNDTDIGDVTLVNSEDVVENNEEDNSTESGESSNLKNENIDSNDGEEEDYFVSSKLDRDTNYASMISNYTKILEDSNINEAQKSIAMNEITKINDTKNAIAICENLLETKGFENSLVLVNDKSVNVVVEVEDGLKTEMVAQIQNIISRELGAEIENIHIAER